MTMGRVYPGSGYLTPTQIEREEWRHATAGWPMRRKPDKLINNVKLTISNKKINKVKLMIGDKKINNVKLINSSNKGLFFNFRMKALPTLALRSGPRASFSEPRIGETVAGANEGAGRFGSSTMAGTGQLISE